MPASRRPTLAASALLLALAAAPAAAQQPPADSLSPNPLQRGARALSFSLPYGGSGEFGYWRMRSDRTSLGLFVTVGASTLREEREGSVADGERRENGFQVGVGPAIRRYAATSGRVAPFLFGRARARYGFSSGWSSNDSGTGSDFDAHSGELGLDLGVGVEWFPTDRVSVSGHTGVGMSVYYLQGEGNGGDINRWEGRMGTFTSALGFSIYLPPRAPAPPAVAREP